MNTKLIENNNGIVRAIQYGKITHSDMEIGLTGKTSLTHGSYLAGCIRSTIDSSCTAERLETYTDNDTVTFHSNNGAVNCEKFHHYIEPDDGMNAQHTTNTVESLNNEIHEDTAHNKILLDDFATNGTSFSEQNSEYFKSYDSFGKETTQGADCCDGEGLEDDPDNAQRYRFEDEIADSFEEDVVLSAADSFRCFLHAAYDIIIAPSYRIPKTVKKIRVYPDNCFFGVCPRCNNSIDREYQTFCNCCGQRLDWSKLDEAEEEWIGGNR